MAKKKSNLPTVKTTYNSFWDSFILRSNGLMVLPKHNPFICTEDKGIIKVVLSEPIHFVGLPYKSTSTKSEKTIDVLINSSEEIYGETLHVERSRVHVSYFDVKNRGGGNSKKDELAVPIESIHYDFDIKQDKAHPLFHAQYCLNIIEKEIRDKSSSFKKYNVQPESLGDDRIQHLKIPTAHMSLFSVLICICADHTASKLPDLLKVLIGAYLEISTMPKAEIKTIYDKIGKYKSFKSMHWYSESA